MQNPYKQRKVKGRNIGEHRLVMEKHLGHRLNTNDHVHHINGNKRDNTIGNLVVLTKSEHSKLHNPQILPTIKTCVVCEKEFTPHPTKRRRQQTCSSDCKTKLMKEKSTASRKLSNEDVTNIFKLKKEGIKGVDIAKLYNVTPAAISYVTLHRPASRTNDI